MYLQVMFAQALIGVQTHDLPSMLQYSALTHSATPARQKLLNA